jgi:hypothetical protein
MAEAIVAEELASRVRELVQRHDGGDVANAARRIGTREADLKAILDAASNRPSLATLSAIVRGYDVDTWWLISGEKDPGSTLPMERRVGTLHLLSELGTTLTMQRRLHSHGNGRLNLDDAAPA